MLLAAMVVMQADGATDGRFRKVTLTDKYYCDGAATGDFNRDGKIDLVAGPFWYEGPDFSKRHVIWPQEPFGLDEGASNSMGSFVGDFDSDGWPDVLVLGRVRFPEGYKPMGWEKVVVHDAFWYRNPGAAARDPWTRHFVFPRVMGESPRLLDMDGDGKPELLTLWDNRFGLLHPNWKRPADPWIFQPVTREKEFRVYYHGTGAGDIDGDGRPDLVLNEGWWLQPRDASATWEEHAFRFSKARGGAQILVYDVDGDGLADAVSSLDGHGWGLSWFQQVNDAGSRSFREHRIMGDRSEEARFGVAFSQVHALAAGDIDGDGLTDVVTGKRWWAHGSHGDIEPEGAPVIYWFRLLRENGSAHFEPHLIDDQSGTGGQIVVEDVTGDGIADIVTASKKGVFVFEGKR